LESKIRETLDARPKEALNLQYKTIWGKATQPWRLASQADWEIVVETVRQSRHTKVKSPYHIEISHSLYKPEGHSNKKAKKKEVEPVRILLSAVSKQRFTHSIQERQPDRTNYLGMIIREHACSRHGHECYVVSHNFFMPRWKTGDHIPIPKQLVQDWATECVCHVFIATSYPAHANIAWRSGLA
jgi:hypothetical protein